MNKLHRHQIMSIFAQKLFLVFIIVSFPCFVLAQMEVGSGAFLPYTPENLIENAFLGEGIEIISINYQGSDEAVGYYSNGGDFISLDFGLIMTTGQTADSNGASGVTKSGIEQSSFDNQSLASDPDIESLADGINVYNVSKYEIEFVPSGDFIQFEYVFASEEYPEYSCSTYNDIFGFFISGPGINGIFENQGKNIALIPNTNQAVTINNIHPQNPLNPMCMAAYAEFFTDNANSNSMPVFNGVLAPLIASTTVEACQTYRLKIVIADLADAQRDSGVFLAGNSFSAAPIDIEMVSPNLDYSISEGCLPLDIIINIPMAMPDDYTLNLSWVGSGDAMTDLENAPSFITIPAGQTQESISILAVEDNNVEGIESIGLIVNSSPCQADTNFFFIQDANQFSPSLGQDSELCPGQTIQIGDPSFPINSSNNLEFSYQGSNQIIPSPLPGQEAMPIYLPIEVSNVQPNIITPELINSVCVNIQHSSISDIDIYLIAPNGKFIALSTDNGGDGDHYIQTCFSPSATQPINFGLSNAPSSAAPFTGYFLPESSFSYLFDSSPVNGTWNLLVFDDQVGITGFAQDWSISFNQSYQLQYQWSPIEGLECASCPVTNLITPNQTTTYQLLISDPYGCFTSEEIVIEVEPSQDQINANCSNQNLNSITFSWEDNPNFTSYQVSTDQINWQNPSNPLSHTVFGLGPNQNITLFIQAMTACGSIDQEVTCQSLNCEPFDIDVLKTNVTCYGYDDGQAIISISGPTSNIYTYNINNTENNTGIFSNLPPSSYIITATDENGCQSDSQFSIYEPPLLQLDLVSITPMDCLNPGTAEVHSQGGTGDISILWSEGSQLNTLITSTIGSYTVTASDINGCQANLEVEIYDISNFSPSIENDSICSNETTGQLAIENTPPNSVFLWDENANNQTESIVENLQPGNYQVTITNGINCTQTLSAEVLGLQIPSLQIVTQNANCNDQYGSASVSVQNTYPPFQFYWSNSQTGPTVNQLNSGDYTVTITDRLGCEYTTQTTVGRNDSLQVQLSQTPPNCIEENSAQIIITPNNASDQIQLLYSIDGGGQMQSDSIFAQLSPGNYNIYIEDQAGCTFIQENYLVEPIEPVQIHIDQELETIHGLRYDLAYSISGGLQPYSYNWQVQSGITISCTDCSNPSIISQGPGSVEVDIIDALGCQTNASIYIKGKFQNEIFIPSAFSPNHDNNNDKLQVYGPENVYIESMQIFNRWGELVFEHNDFFPSQNIGWDGLYNGNIAPSGVYIAVIKAQFPLQQSVIFSQDVSLFSHK